MDEFQRAEKYAYLLGRAETLLRAALRYIDKTSGQEQALTQRIEQFLVVSEAAFKRVEK